MAIGTGAAILGGALVGGGASLLASNRAADAQQDAAGRAANITREELAQQRQFFDEAQEIQRPGRQVGQQALNSLAVLFGLEPAVPSGVSNQEVINAQIARETQPQQPGSAPAAPATPQFSSLDEIPQEVVRRYRNVVRNGNFHTQRDLNGRNRRNRAQFQDEFISLRNEYPGLSELDSQLDVEQQFRRIGRPQPQSSAAGSFNPLASAALNAPATPIGGQQTQLQRTGFLDEPNNPAPTREGVLQSLEDFPVSDFLRDEGMRGIQDSAAARGSLSSGRTLRSLVEFNQNFADANAVQPFIGGLQGLAGVGQQAASGQQNAITNAASASQGGASNLANIALQQGNSRASAFQGMNDAFQGTLGNLTTAFLLRDQFGGTT